MKSSIQEKKTVYGFPPLRSPADRARRVDPDPIGSENFASNGFYSKTKFN
jgi:hypothetical protein